MLAPTLLRLNTILGLFHLKSYWWWCPSVSHKKLCGWSDITAGWFAKKSDIITYSITTGPPEYCGVPQDTLYSVGWSKRLTPPSYFSN